MRIPIAVWAAMVGLIGTTAPAQTTQPSDRMDQFERRLDEIERRHQAELKARDDEIAKLRQQVAAPATSQADSVEKTRQDILKDIEENRTPFTLRTPANF